MRSIYLDKNYPIQSRNLLGLNDSILASMFLNIVIPFKSRIRNLMKRYEMGPDFILVQFAMCWKDK